MKYLLSVILLLVMYPSAYAQMPFSTVAQIFDFSIGDTLEYECWAHQGPNSCVPQSDFMNVVIAKNITSDSLQYTFRGVGYTYSDPCFTPPFGTIDTFTQTYANPDSSIFWYHNPARYSYGPDSVYTDTVFMDPSLHNRKRNEHQEGSFATWGDTIYVDGLGIIYYDYGYESDGQVTYYCGLQYYHKATGETWGTPMDINPSLGIEDVSAYHGVNVFPNPAHGVLNITCTGASVTGIELYNITGALLRTINRPADMPIDIYDVAPGVYYARITTTQGTVVRKWIKQ